MRRRFILLGWDLFWVAISPFVALFIRDNLVFRPEAFAAASNYAALGVLAGAVVLPIMGVSRSLWRYTSLPDLLRLVMAITAIVLLSLLASFAVTRLEHVSRSLPIIQWLVLFASLTGSRVAIRIWRDRPQPTSTDVSHTGSTESILIVGVNQVAELYLRSIGEFAPRRTRVLGVIASGVELPGRMLGPHRVLGQPEDIMQVVRQLDVHGETLTRVVVADRPSRLSESARDALVSLERTAVKVDWLHEILGFDVQGKTNEASGGTQLQHARLEPLLLSAAHTSRGYRSIKRCTDIVGSCVLMVVLAPITAAIAVLTVLDVGFPAIFWQRRPGRHGRPFKLYKFRTMREAHTHFGIRIPDQERSSKLGAWVRRSRLDELPQLYNILVGEMSFVGPRPLLSFDQPDDKAARLSVRPGLTGMAQAYGRRTMPPDDKNTLDIWYIQNASLWLDFKIILRTMMVLVRGEHLDIKMLHRAEGALRKLRSPDDLPRSYPARWKRQAVQPFARSAE